MRSGKKQFIFLFLMFAIPSIALEHPTKKLTVGLAFRFDDNFNKSVSMLHEGIETAKSLFEKAHPEVTITLKKFSHELGLETVSATGDRIAAQKISAVIGAEMSDEALVLGERLGTRKIVLVTPTATNPKVTENKPYTFQMSFSDTEVADRLARYIVVHQRPKVLGVFQNISYNYSNYLSTRFVETVKKLTVADKPPFPIVIQEVLRRTSDFSKQIKYFKKHKVTHLAIFSFDSDLTGFVSQANKQAFFPVYIGSDGWGTNKYVYSRMVQEPPMGEKFVAFRNSYWKNDIKTDMADQFRKAFQKRYHRPPSGWNAIAFDAAWVLFTAMAKCKNPDDGDAIRKELKQLEPLPVVTAPKVSFGVDNVPVKDLYIFKISRQGISYEVTL
jgi:branched-chain amino acid transport system substrate-binding protein